MGYVARDAVFGGEDFLLGTLPDYENLWRSLTTKVVIALAFWLVLVPMVRVAIHFDDQEQFLSASNDAKRQTRKGAKESPRSHNLGFQTLSVTLSFMFAGCFLTVAGLLLYGLPPTYSSSRGVFQAPILTLDDCIHVISMADEAAARNSKVAKGATTASESEENVSVEAWTDLGFGSDPFADEKLHDFLKGRLIPTLARTYGLSMEALRANDLSVVRSVAEGSVPFENRANGADLAVQILLNDDFEGGGTCFWNRFWNQQQQQQPFANVQPVRPGTLIAYSTAMSHERMPVSAGTQLLLVVYLSVNPEAGLSRFASWTALPTNLFRRVGAESTAVWVFGRVQQGLKTMGDVLGRHHVTVLVKDEDAAQYLESLDAAYEKAKKKRRRKRSTTSSDESTEEL
jgi:hypothetical protein